MRLDWWFRLLNHVTLAVSCVCLVEAETFFLPDLWLLLAPVLGLLVAAALTEGRWALPVWGANLLGVGIAGGGGAWLLQQLQAEDSWVRNTPMPAALVPLLGPLLMALLLVKLFRPRARGDFWLLHGMGLLQVGLACVLANSPLFGALLAGYVACALACLTLYHLTGEQPSDAGPGGLGSPAGFLLSSLLRAAAVGAGAVLLFLLTPRLGVLGENPLRRATQGPSNLPAQVGYTEEINLNRTGPVEVNDEVAFAVTATHAGGEPKLDLPADQHWRGIVLDRYDQGVWTSLIRLPDAGRSRQHRLPDLGPDQYFLTFAVQPGQAGGLFLADPVLLGPPGARLPVLSRSDQGRRQPPLFFEFSGTVLPLVFPAQQEYRYVQVCAPTAQSRAPAEGLLSWYAERLTLQPLPGLDRWTAKLARRLAADPHSGLAPAQVPADAGERDWLPLPDQWEGLARALSDYLSSSGEYTYSLDLRRQDQSADPVLDFLENVKEGSCERYAAALTLMLRALGIPARIVKGFRGAEGLGDGTYLVRQSQAHTWVEALVPRPGSPEERYDWLTLDPTPVTDAPARPGFSLARWWENSRRNGYLMWRNLIVDYDADQQADLWDGLVSGRRLAGLRAALAAGLAILLAFLVLAVGVRLWRRAGAGRPGPWGHPAAPFYARLVALLSRYADLRPGPAQTPREFGAAAREVLQAIPAAADLAGLPGRVAELFYRVRFGGRALAAEERHALDAELDRLAGALRGRAAPGRPG